MMVLPLTYSRRKRIRDQEGKTADLRTFPFGNKLLQQLFSEFVKIDTHLSFHEMPLFRTLVLHIRDELGVPALSRSNNIREEFYWWWMSEHQVSCPNHEFRLDAIEIACTYPLQYIRAKASIDPSWRFKRADKVVEGVKVINARMAEDGLGYRFENKQVVEVASEYLHEAAVEPVLGLISNPAFAAVDQEFRDALAEFRAGNFDDCIADCGNALESALKVIGTKKRWEFDPKDRAAKLINLAFEKGLIPSYLQSQFSGLQSVLNGIPAVRNNSGGHGAGVQPLVVDRHFAEYQLHQTAGAILFLIRCAEK